MSSRLKGKIRASARVCQDNASKGSSRPDPRQSRSRDRVERLLEAASEVIAQTSYESATTNAIAERAGVSIGSLYRYFPDKQAILRALEERRRAQVRALYDRAFNEDIVYLPLPVLIDRLVDPFLDLHLKSPAWAHLFLASEACSDVAAATSCSENEVIERLSAVFRRVFPKLGQDHSRLVAAVCKANVKAMVATAFSREQPADRRRLVAEMKRMLQVYLESVAGREPGE
jgi:AcrR family transcriptional regulator